MLTTKRLTLRAPREDDLHAMFAVYSNSNAMKYWFTPPHEDISVTKKLLDGRISHWSHTPTNFQIELDGSFIGNAGNFSKTNSGRCWCQIIGAKAMCAKRLRQSFRICGK